MECVIGDAITVMEGQRNDNVMSSAAPGGVLAHHLLALTV